jgi:hypothetical protein
MSWKRLGVVFAPDGNRPWARSHAALPTPVHVADDVFRFFYSSRDAERRSHVGWVDVEVSETPRVLNAAGEPILSPGVDGAFDDSGVSIGCIAQHDGGIGLYYMGWNLGVRSPWRNAIGLARAQSLQGPFERFSPGPILDRSPEDPYTLSYPFVLRFGPQDWRMWYGSNLTAAVGNADINHAIKLARSHDGVHWTRDGATVVGFAEGEHALARPSVVKVGEKLLMCFACRGESYRIGAAVSRDGINWTRCDAAMGLGPSSQGWDSEMTCYPTLFWHRDRLWLAYNGNGYGATGFGLAVREGAFAV